MRIRLAVAATLTFAFAMGQDTAPRPQFEVAAIKTNKSGGPAISLGSSNPGRWAAENVFLGFLIQYAWNVRSYQIVDLPDSINSERFDIQATMKTGANQDEIRVMLQGLLEERFQLKLHRESREQPVYVLSVAKGGAKIQPLVEGSCISLRPGEMPAAREPGQPQPKYCGGSSSGPGQIKGNGIPITMFATLLSSVMQRSVVDQTALLGLFDIQLQWMADETTPGQFALGRATTGAPSETGPSVFTAIQEQLGLRLESAKGPVEVLVMDSVQRPSEN